MSEAVSRGDAASRSAAALETVRLQDESASLEATFVPAAGMLCCSLRHRGEELLAQRAGLEAYVGRGKTMGIPLLYPWANRLAAFDYSVGERKVTVPQDGERVALDGRGLPIHGVIGGRLEWELEREPAPDARSLRARLAWSESKPELFEVFPFRHDLRYEANLAGGRLEVWVTVGACGADAVPVAFGFHPYLTLPGAPRESWRVELPAMRHLALDANQIPRGPDQEQPARIFELSGHEFDDGFEAVANPERFAVSGGGRRMELEFLEGYPCAQVFAPAGGQFICFEPMTAPANALRSGAGLRVLAPGESCRAGFAVCVSQEEAVGGAVEQHERLLHRAYEAFNARDIDSALATMHPHVDWPNAMEGGRVHGHSGVRTYWERQWGSFDSQVQPLHIELNADGGVVASVHQLVRDLAGNVLSDATVEHHYVVTEGLIERMDVHAR
jgi:galactose mutarotase-like enzyme